MKKIYVVGIGPGEYEQMTIRAVKALESCDVIIGYTVYVDLVPGAFCRKRVPDDTDETGSRALPYGF